MAIHLPPAIPVNNFVGGYKSIKDYTSLGDTETSDAQNVAYSPSGDLGQVLGTQKLLTTALVSTGGSTGRPITGHYFFDKLGVSSGFHVVAAGDSLFNYNSSTASVVRSGLTDNSGTYWTFVQIQDPRSASDDIVVATNGVDPIQVWNGSGTAIALSSFTSATQVPVAKFLLQHKSRIYAANITDVSSADAAAAVRRTGFGTDAAANPHRFTESFVVGGSTKSGDITGQRVLNDDIIYYKKNAIWRFSPSIGDTSDLRMVTDSVGCFAPRSLVDAGNLHLFLSERGVFGFDGNNFIHISENVDDVLLKNTNQSALVNSVAIFDKTNNQYKLFVPQSGSNRNDLEFVYDVRPNMKIWQPPIFGKRVSVASEYTDTDNITRQIVGDYFGYLYRDEVGNNFGIGTGYNGTITSATINSLTDSAANFSTAGDGLRGLSVLITGGMGENQVGIVQSNTTAVITLESNWTQQPDSASTYSVAAIDSYWRSKDYDFGGADIAKVFRQLLARIEEVGDFNLLLHYIIDFKSITQATLKTLSMYLSGMVWGISRWGNVRWGGADNIKKRVDFRSTQNQSTMGNHLALRFSNRRANERWRLSGFDVTFKAIGKR